MEQEQLSEEEGEVFIKFREGKESLEKASRPLALPPKQQ
jgi:hypothetical protein